MTDFWPYGTDKEKRLAGVTLYDTFGNSHTKISSTKILLLVEQTVQTQISDPLIRIDVVTTKVMNLLVVVMAS